jgi:hypothetical protein
MTSTRDDRAGRRRAERNRQGGDLRLGAAIKARRRLNDRQPDRPQTSGTEVKGPDLDYAYLKHSHD